MVVIGRVRAIQLVSSEDAGRGRVQAPPENYGERVRLMAKGNGIAIASGTDNGFNAPHKWEISHPKRQVQKCCGCTEYGRDYVHQVCDFVRRGWIIDGSLLHNQHSLSFSLVRELEYNDGRKALPQVFLAKEESRNHTLSYRYGCSEY